MKPFTDKKNIEYNPFDEENNVIEKKDDKFSRQTEDAGIDEQYRTISFDSYVKKQKEINNERKKENPSLIHVSTQKKTLVDKSEFIIGRKTNSDGYDCDLSFESKFISRRHAGIIKRQGKYYITDYESVNKTYINGKIVPKNQEIEIENGARITFANEEFIFFYNEN